MKKFTKKDFLRALASLEKNGLRASSMAADADGSTCLVGHLAGRARVEVAQKRGIFADLGEEVAQAALGTGYETAWRFNDIAQLEDLRFLRLMSSPATKDEVATLLAFGAAGMFNEFQKEIQNLRGGLDGFRRASDLGAETWRL